jgi:hypothetical protein
MLAVSCDLLVKAFERFQHVLELSCIVGEVGVGISELAAMIFRDDKQGRTGKEVLQERGDVSEGASFAEDHPGLESISEVGQLLFNVVVLQRVEINW